MSGALILLDGRSQERCDKVGRVERPEAKDGATNGPQAVMEKKSIHTPTRQMASAHRLTTKLIA
jgi:hypothetical protein